MAEIFTDTTTLIPTSFSFSRVLFDVDAQYVLAVVRGSDGVERRRVWHGPEALTLITTLNSADFTTVSLIATLFAQLATAPLGPLPAGAVSGYPGYGDPPEEEEED